MASHPFRVVEWFDGRQHRSEKRGDRAYPNAIREAESERLRARRIGEAKSERPPLAVGLSGGGIRSATFCLGFFQGLAKLNPAARPSDEPADDATLRAGSLLGRLDAISAVSGGGYFGAFFGRFFQPRQGEPTGGDRLPAVERSLADDFSPEMTWLRENGRYLAPNGSGDALLAGAAIFRNWVALMLVLTSFVVTASLALQLFRLGAFDLLQRSGGGQLPEIWIQLTALLQGQPPHTVWRSPLLALPLIAAVAFVAPALWAYWLLPNRKRRRPSVWNQLALRFPLFAAITLLLAAASAAFLVVRPVPPGAEADVLAAVAWALLVVCSLALVYWLGHYRPFGDFETVQAKAPGVRTQLAKFLRFWLFTTLGLLAVGLVDGLGQTLYVAAREGSEAVNAFLVGLIGGGGLLAEGVRRLLKLLGSRFGGGKGSGFGVGSLRLALVVAATVAVVAVALLASTLSHAIVWAFEPPHLDGVELAFLEPARGEQVIAVDETGGYYAVSLRLTHDDGEAPAARRQRAHLLAVAAFVLFGGLSLGISRIYSFLNYSSHHNIYAARLTRAYLGASNPVRHRDDVKVTEVHPQDDVSDLRDYRPHEHGGPLHFVNVTVNETISGRSNVQQQDRKGVGLAAGPCGLSAGKSHHALWRGERHANGTGGDGFRMFPGYGPEGGFRPEPLSLGQWVAISGAAFTTGAGMRTSLPLAILAGLANVRLGYWWDSDVDREEQSWRSTLGEMPSRPSKGVSGLLRTLFPIQLHLLDELTARFRGPSIRRWYLSDGGHFENLGGYELVRRRFPFILLLDAEADPDYGYEGLAGLVRKARLDFGAEIRFLDDEELVRLFDGRVPRAFGPVRRQEKEAENGAAPAGDGIRQVRSLARLARGGERECCSQSCAALAVVEYPRRPGADERPVSLLVYVKAALCEDAPLDLAEYHQNHPDFPHESTGDQFFDEAQWESYRRLGEWQAMTLFAADGWDLLGDGGSKRRVEALIDRLNRSMAPEPADLPGSGLEEEG